LLCCNEDKSWIPAFAGMTRGESGLSAAGRCAGRPARSKRCKSSTVKE
jgi:hypothetical protein